LHLISADAFISVAYEGSLLFEDGFCGAVSTPDDPLICGGVVSVVDELPFMGKVFTDPLLVVGFVLEPELPP
jgi:hypothetical protein